MRFQNIKLLVMTYKHRMRVPRWIMQHSILRQKCFSYKNSLLARRINLPAPVITIFVEWRYGLIFSWQRSILLKNKSIIPQIASSGVSFCTHIGRPSLARSFSHHGVYAYDCLVCQCIFDLLVLTLNVYPLCVIWLLQLMVMLLAICLLTDR